MINVVIFSKDRACQLDALLRSLYEHLKIDYDVVVLFDYSNKEYSLGYEKIMTRYPNISFVKETNFYEDTLRISLDEKYVSFLWLVDDCIMKNDFTYDSILRRFLEDDTVGVYNLRLTPTVTRMTDWPDDVERPFPEFGSDNTWEWRTAVDTDWSYPMTMDGHMYKTKDMIPYLRNRLFGPPPSMDSIMHSKPLDRPLMICNTQQKILGIVPNRVQTGSPNRHGDVSTKEMNDLWLSGKQIDLDHLYELNETCGKYHYISIKFEERI
ncbi:MAG: hypothetical protein DRO67_09560 [Candidatus Asgardarchaeum californiense]|nr:MAG: hypothetical protein DRO67_09560 [Candidatus Asgardarchaeum californiense]